MTAPRRPFRRRLRTFVVALVFVLFIAGSWLLMWARQVPPPSIPAEALQEAAYAAPRWVGNLAHKDLEEASGFARSHLARDRMWLLNDSSNPERLYAIGLRGQAHGVVKVRGVENDDWEDLASYELDGQPYLLIAETGDNFSRKKKRAFHAVKEPAFSAGEAPKKVDVDWTLEFRFEDGPRDCEAVAVDVVRREILLLTKRDLPARLYVLDLPGAEGPANDRVAVARYLTDVFNIPQPTQEDVRERSIRGAWLGQPTSLDIAPDGKTALALTYGAAYLFSRSEDEDWAAAFQRRPLRVRTPTLLRAEAIGFIPGGESFLLTTEARSAPVYRYDALAR